MLIGVWVTKLAVGAYQARQDHDQSPPSSPWLHVRFLKSSHPIRLPHHVAHAGKQKDTPPLGPANPAVTSFWFVLHRLAAPDRLGQQNPGKIKRRDHAPQLDGFCKGAAPQRAMPSFRSPRLSTHFCDRFCCGASSTFRNQTEKLKLN